MVRQGERGRLESSWRRGRSTTRPRSISFNSAVCCHRQRCAAQTGVHKASIAPHQRGITMDERTNRVLVRAERECRLHRPSACPTRRPRARHNVRAYPRRQRAAERRVRDRYPRRSGRGCEQPRARRSNPSASSDVDRVPRQQGSMEQRLGVRIARVDARARSFRVGRTECSSSSPMTRRVRPRPATTRAW
jgi:hypothetical protein